ncbi:HD-GYP domain-containing protein [Paenibacillus sp. y28]|uniref:HD-GYP domain-containing protein n=1 Tax=Paenibacillus sp. y28 TaxID=3129110 RepID=UPI0030196662
MKLSMWTYGELETMRRRIGHPDMEFLLKRQERTNKARYDHSLRVAYYCNIIAQELDWNEPERLRLMRAALLHEIDPSADWKKTTRASAALQARIGDQCPEAAAGILREWKLEELVHIDAVQQYQENLDGTGLPNSLCWNEICQAARILRVADSFDRMTRCRPEYGQSPLSEREALEELFRWSDMMYDAETVELFQAVIQRKLGEAAPSREHK